MEIDLKYLEDLYRDELLESVLPFWLKHSLDTEYGGYFTCLDRQGKVYDTDKFLWLQARQVWTFSKLYVDVERNPIWLECALHGAEFLMKHGHDGKWNWYFSLTRDGRPLTVPHNIYAHVFACMALGQLNKATGIEEYGTAAYATWEVILSRLNNPKDIWNKEYPGTRKTKSFALPMILCNLTLEISHLLKSGDRDRWIKKCIHEVMDVFYKEEYGLVLENLNDKGEVIDTFDGRLINPGHAIEAMWFVMDLGSHLNDQGLIKRANKIAIRMLEYGWDNEHGGIFYFQDRKGYPTQQLEWDQKLWWVHLEALVALLKGYQYTGDERCIKWFSRLHAYSWTHFRDSEFGEWYGYLNRQGDVLLPLKGGKWKGCFHVPRGLYQCWQTLRMINETNDKK